MCSPSWSIGVAARRLPFSGSAAGLPSAST